MISFERVHSSDQFESIYALIKAVVLEVKIAIV